jgi:hypothetical protein
VAAEAGRHTEGTASEIDIEACWKKRRPTRRSSRALLLAAAAPSLFQCTLRVKPDNPALLDLVC